MPNTTESYNLNSMDAHNTDHDSDYDQEESLLHEDGQSSRPKRVYQNSDRTLIILGAIGSVVITGLALTLFLLFFAGRHRTLSPFEKSLALPAFGDIGCEFPGEVVSPMLEQNLTLLDDTLAIVTTGRAIGDVVFHTETEAELEYVRLDVKFQGPRKSDLHSVYTRVREGRYELQTPETPGECMRYTLEVWLPKHLTSLSIRTETLVHISFQGMHIDSSIYELDLKLGGDHGANLLLLPEARIANAKYMLTSGFVGGTTILYNSLAMESGQAQVDVEVVLMRDADSTEVQYHSLEMLTATRGLFRTTVKNPDFYTFRSRYRSSEAAQMVLRYPLDFAGELSMKASQVTVDKAEADITEDCVVHVGDRGVIMSDLRVSDESGHVWLTFDQ